MLNRMSENAKAPTLDLAAVAAGFSRKALVYDAYGAGHPAIQWTRAQVRAAVLAHTSPGARVLELNAGTGEDAAFYASHGRHVHATDLAEGMVAECARKAAAHPGPGRLTAQRLSFLNLAAAPAGPYDLVLSNFGGLNCIPDLRPVAAQLPAVLRPGGWVVWVVMPPLCPWELAQALRGRLGVALRRVRGRTLAHVAGAHFVTYYHPPAAVRRALGPRFQLVDQHSLSLFSPPAFMDGFPRRHPRLFHALTAVDARLTRWPVLRTLGDFVLFAARYTPTDAAA